MAPGDVITCTATYVVTQADLNNGSVNDSATATGTPPSGPAVTSSPSTAAVAVAQAGALTIVKSATPTTVATVGDSVSYSFVVTNTGNVTLANVGVTDTQTAPAGALTSGPTCPAGAASLTPGATVTCTATYVVTQADLDAGTIRDSAFAAGTLPTGGTTTSSPSAVTVTATQTAAVSVVKSASPATVNAVGDVVTYTFVVTNTGNVSVINPTVTDTQTAPALALTSGPTCPTGSLAPGASANCTATYTVTQADLDNGSVTDTATASATSPGGNPVPPSPNSTATVTATQAPALTLVKAFTITDANHDGATGVGDTITWTFTVTNSGNVTVSTLAIDDPTAGSATCVATSLAPGASTTCTGDAVHTITQADVDASGVSNTATATGTAPSSLCPTAPSANCPVVSPPSTATVPLSAVASLGLTKTAAPNDIDGNGVINPGDTIHWVLTATNTGTTALTNVAVDDPFAGPVTCPQTTLLPGQSVVCTVADYTVTDADGDNGIVTNTASAGATGVAGPVVSPDVSAEVDIVNQLPFTPGGPGGGGNGGGNQLPFTGVDHLIGLLTTAFLMLVVGFGLILVARRRRRAE